MTATTCVSMKRSIVTSPVFFGPSGCGKTSLLEIIAGLRRSGIGRVALGNDVWQDTESRRFVKPEHRRVGYVPQSGLLFPHRSVSENLKFGIHRADNQASRNYDRVVEILELGALTERQIDHLSGGERQRVALGRALCSAPRLLLLDEPLSALDYQMRQRILPFLARVRHEYPIPMIWVSHDPIEVQALCDDLIVLRDGQRIGRGRPDKLLTNPDVFPIAHDQGYDNVLPCRVESSGSMETTVSLGRDSVGPKLVLNNLTDQPLCGDWVQIPARSVLLATEAPRAISARNVLPAKIATVKPIGNVVLATVTLAPDLPDLAVELTHDACDSLNIAAGATVFVLIKSTACSLFGGANESPTDPLSRRNHTTLE